MFDNLKSSPVPTSGGSLESIEAALLQLLAAVRSQGDGLFVSKISPRHGGRAVTVADLCNEFLISKARAGRSDNYLGLLVKELRSFSKHRASRAVASVSSSEIESWLHSNNWSPRTQKGRLLTLRTLLAWAVTRGELVINPALGVDVPTQSNEPPGIHTPEETKIVLEAARKIDLNAMRCFSIRYFAGLRTSEAVALEEKEIGENYIEVTAAKSKTRRRRLVTIQPNLRAWLALGGVLPLNQVHNRLRAVTRQAGVPWPKNVCRHSFVSYHLAKFQNAGKTALEAGHTEQMLFAHYREIVTSDSAREFFEILPAQDSI
jgi:integrase